MCCRSVTKGEEAKEEVVKRSGIAGEKIHVVQLDLADLDNIGSFRSRYDAEKNLAGRPIDMLILNAGVMALNKREVTKQGLEMQMGTNVVGHFKFTAVMFDLCKAASTSRIVAVSSGAHKLATKIDFEDFNREKKYRKWTVYGETKLGNLLYIRKLNSFLEEKGINNVIAVACHPGYANTNLQSHTVFKRLNYVFAQNSTIGAEPTVLAATDPKAERNWYAGPDGAFEMRGHAKWKAGQSKLVRNTKLQDDLWKKCEEITGCDFVSKM